MEFEGLKTIDGLGDRTIDKLEQSGYSIETLSNVAVDELVDIGIEKSIADKIISFIESDGENIVNNDLAESLKHDISEAKDYLIEAFEKSECYKEEYTDEEKAIAYDKWFEGLLRKNNYLRR